MNKIILNIEIQNFINTHLKSDISSLLFKGTPFKDIDTKIIVEQIEAKKRAEKKLPLWFNTKDVYYPNKLNIEQTSSAVTAQYKARLISGKTLIDLTGGLGIDAYYFSKNIAYVTHCEINSELSEIAKHNYHIFKTYNVVCVNDDGIDTLKRLDRQFDWVYIDPSRRDHNKKKVFMLTDCTPNVQVFQNLFLEYASNVMIKTSPLLDIKATLHQLKHVKDIHIVAVNNEVKELLWIIEHNFGEETSIKTVNIKKENHQYFEFKYNDETTATSNLSLPLTYIYEPNTAILKSGAFNTLSQKFNVFKLHKHSHLYTSNELKAFPGKSFKIEKTIPFNKKAFLKEGISKANVTTRNFNLSVLEIRKKLKIKDGGHYYLFFTTDKNHTKIIIICTKAYR